MTTTAAQATSASERSSVIRVSLIRGLLALLWAAAFATAPDPLNAVAIALLVIYPLIDAVSCAVDYLATPNPSERRVTAFNGILSTTIAIALGIAGTAGGVPAVLTVFGAWATLSGAAQLVVGIHRRGPILGKQWPTLISGGLSALVGAVYIAQAAGDSPTLDVLSVYATGGGIFFLVQSALLLWKARTRRASGE
ncbi:DUF308 domain-containing protein [Nocardia concava]|uniref:DUF308 domain-containing protein n=1 Tax=Nocardia concava TaxID=257281 RepID=UPI00030D6C72|nr:DUF308 domain-containing protein [Nocardia concava]